MLQMELNVATLQCQNPGGSRAYEDQYRAFIGKFQTQMSANGRSMQQLAGRKRFNLDVVVTEFANRTAQRAPTDKEFCRAASAPSTGPCRRRSRRSSRCRRRSISVPR